MTDAWWEKKQSWSVDEILNSTFPDLCGYLNAYMLVEGTISVIAGFPGVGKSYLGMKAADCISTARTFAQMPTRLAKVVYVSEEMTVREMKPRMADFAIVSRNGSLAFRFAQGIRLNLPNGISKLQRIVEEEKANLVFVDALRDAHSGPESSNDYMAMILTRARDEVARNLGCHVLFIHHSGKDYGEEHGASDVRGASAIEAVAADVMVVKRTKEGERYLRFKKVRHGPEPDPINFKLAQNLAGKTDVEFSYDE